MTRAISFVLALQPAQILSASLPLRQLPSYSQRAACSASRPLRGLGRRPAASVRSGNMESSSKSSLCDGSSAPSSPTSPSSPTGSGKQRHHCLCSPTKHAGSFRCRLHRSSSTEWEKVPSTPRTPNSDTKPIDVRS